MGNDNSHMATPSALSLLLVEESTVSPTYDTASDEVVALCCTAAAAADATMNLCRKCHWGLSHTAMSCDRCGESREKKHGGDASMKKRADPEEGTGYTRGERSPGSSTSSRSGKRTRRFCCCALLVAAFLVLTFSGPTLHTADDDDRTSTKWQRASLAQAAMLHDVHVPLHTELVTTQRGKVNYIRTPLGKPPLVLVHGWGGALGHWRQNLDGLSEHYTVYALDVLGWGLSSRPHFDGDSIEAMAFWVEALEAWAQAIHLNNFTLLGHSLGGYISGRYALKYPHRVRHLILACAAGVTPDFTITDPTLRTLSKLELAWGASLPFSVVRGMNLLGFGEWLMRKIECKDKAEMEYILATALLPPSGEVVTMKLRKESARQPTGAEPLWDDLGKLQMPVSMVFGELDTTCPPKGEWGDTETLMKKLAHPGKVEVVPAADHSVYNSVEAFNKFVVDCAAMRSSKKRLKKLERKNRR